MLGRAALKWGKIAPVGVRSSSGGGGHTDIPSIPATSGEIALPRDKNIFVPTPTPENITQETKDKYYPTLGKIQMLTVSEKIILLTYQLGNIFQIDSGIILFCNKPKCQYLKVLSSFC